MEKECVVIDIETTGLSAYYHKITEIAALKYYNGKLSDEFVTLVNPEVPIPRFITQLTGINNEMVRDAPKISKVISKFKEFLSNAVFVGHNAGFDYKFLDHNSRLLSGEGLNNPILCTCRLARRLLPELPRKNLGSLCTHFNIQNMQAHRARGDALAAAQILHNFLQILSQKEINSAEEILNFQKSKIPKLAESASLRSTTMASARQNTFLHKV